MFGTELKRLMVAGSGQEQLLIDMEQFVSMANEWERIGIFTNWLTMLY